MKPYSSDGPDGDIAQPSVEIFDHSLEKTLEEHDIPSQSQAVFCYL